MIGWVAVPVTSIPVAWRQGLLHAFATTLLFTAPSSLWFEMFFIDKTVAVDVTAYLLGPFRTTP